MTFEQKLTEIKRLIDERERINEQLFELLNEGVVITSGVPLKIKVPESLRPPKCGQCGKTTHSKENCPRLKKRDYTKTFIPNTVHCSICKKPGHRSPTCPNKDELSGGQIMEMFEDHYSKGLGIEDCCDKYGITMSRFYKMKEEFKRRQPQRVASWVKYRKGGEEGPSEEDLEEMETVKLSSKGVCKYCGGDAPDTHTVCRKCESDNAKEVYEMSKLPSETADHMTPEKIKEMVVRDIVDRVPVNELCATYRINMRTFARLSKEFRDANPELVASWKDVPKARSFNGTMQLKSFFVLQ